MYCIQQYSNEKTKQNKTKKTFQVTFYIIWTSVKHIQRDFLKYLIYFGINELDLPGYVALLGYKKKIKICCMYDISKCPKIEA